MFQDEARFGRISDTRRCLMPKTCPSCLLCHGNSRIAVSTDGILDTLILPSTNSICMQIFLEELASRHADERIVIILDGAGRHTSGLLAIPDNILLPLPPCSPELKSCRTPMG